MIVSVADAKIRGQKCLYFPNFTFFTLEQTQQFSCYGIVLSIRHNLSIFLNCWSNSACVCECVSESCWSFMAGLDSFIPALLIQLEPIRQAKLALSPFLMPA